MSRLLHGAVIQAFFIQYNVGLDNPAAGTGRNTGAVENEQIIIELFAPHAIISLDRTVKFQHHLAACHLMQSVDILRYDRLHFSRLFQLCKFTMRLVGFCCRDNHLFTVKIKKLPGMSGEKRMAQHRFRRILVLLVVKTVYTAKIGYPAFSGHPCPAKKHDVVTVGYDFLQLFHSSHSTHPSASNVGSAPAFPYFITSVAFSPTVLFFSILY